MVWLCCFCKVKIFGYAQEKVSSIIAETCQPLQKPGGIKPRSARPTAERGAVKNEKIPIIALLSPRGGNGAVMGISEQRRWLSCWNLFFKVFSSGYMA